MRRLLMIAALAAVSFPAAADETADRMRADFGVEPVALRQSAAGYMLDLRVRIVDPVKARRFLDPAVSPSLREEESGAVLGVPASDKVGPLRQTIGRIEVGRIFAVMFANPARRVAPGRRVTLSVGKEVIGGLTVEG